MEEKLEVTEEILKQRELEEEEWYESEDSSSDTEEEAQNSPEDESSSTDLSHVKSIPQKSQFIYSCFDCGKEVVNKEDLIVHKRKHHSKIKQCKHYRAKGFCHFGEACPNIHKKKMR